MKVRVLKTDHQSAAFNMALDEVLIERIAEGLALPSLRFYGWSPRAVSIGYFQSLESEVDLEQCKKQGVDFIRRQTGGGAVFHDEEVTYSFHVPQSAKLVSDKISVSYKEICEALIKGLAEMNIEAVFAGLNDIVVATEIGHQKISGNAQTRKKGVVLQHGTILKAVDVDRMFSLLKVPDEKLKGKLISQIKQRVTSIEKFLEREVSFESIVDNLMAGFESHFSQCEFFEDELTEEEKALTEKLMSEKYQSNDWNYLR
jgi:lipoate-protein ligase A